MLHTGHSDLKFITLFNHQILMKRILEQIRLVLSLESLLWLIPLCVNFSIILAWGLDNQHGVYVLFIPLKNIFAGVSSNFASFDEGELVTLRIQMVSSCKWSELLVGSVVASGPVIVGGRLVLLEPSVQKDLCCREASGRHGDCKTWMWWIHIC